MSMPLWQTWWREVRRPTYFFVVLAGAFALTDWDLAIADAWFFDRPHARWIGSHSWWAQSFLHTGGQWAIRIVVVAAVVLWLASFVSRRLQAVHRPAAYFALATVLGIGIVGALKMLTNVDCPWDLLPFGGRMPVVSLFGDRPDALRAGHCFPAAHASSGYALIALYFVARERSRTRARLGVALGLVCGVAFGLAQQSRGAHFMSHDLWSAYLIWVTAASVYVFGFRMRLHAGPLEITDGKLGRVDVGGAWVLPWTRS